MGTYSAMSLWELSNKKEAALLLLIKEIALLSHLKSHVETAFFVLLICMQHVKLQTLDAEQS